MHRQNEINIQTGRGAKINVVGLFAIINLLSLRIINQKLRTMIVLQKIEPWKLAPLSHGQTEAHY